MQPFDALHELELRRAAERVRASYRRWAAAAATNAETERLDAPRRQALCAVMDALLERERLLAGSTAADLRFACAAQTAQTWTLFQHVLSQRRDLETGELLQRADGCSAAAYVELAGDHQALAPPIVVVESIDSPVTYARNSFVNAPSLVVADPRSFPIPIVLIPPSYTLCPWLLTTVHHEIGHSLDHDLALGATLANLLETALPAAKTPVADRELWRSWIGEMVADLCGTLASGPAFVWSLAEIFDRQRSWDAFDVHDTHPPPLLRLRLLVEMLGARAGGLRGLREQVVAASRAVIPDALSAQAIAVAAALQALSRALRVPDAAEDDAVTEQMVAWLVGDESDGGHFPLRLVPAAAQLALVSSRQRSTDPEHIVARAQRLMREVIPPSWMAPSQHWDDLRSHVLGTKPPILSGLATRMKVPPAELLDEHETLSFIGATHHQLPAQLCSSFERRKRKWKLIEIFFLADERLEAIAVGERGPASALKQQALSQLRALLPSCTERWELREYSSPFLFASFWDAEKPGGRIHVSPYIWGQDISTCPAIDYLRHEGEPTPQYAAYVRGLAALRREARPL